MNIQDHVMANVNKLDLINNKEKYVDYFENEMNKIGNTIVAAGHIPFIVHSTCHCGCGEISYQINSDIISKQQAMKLFLEAAESIRQELSKLN